MFARIMAMVLAVILLTTVGLSVVWWITLRNQQIDSRLDYLYDAAEEIARMAADLSGITLQDSFKDRESESRTLTYMNEKAEKIDREFGAFIAVMDRNTNVMTNAQAVYEEDPDFVADITDDETIDDSFERILRGEKIVVRSVSGGSPAFTVGVPYERDGKVEGAVFIRTKAQRIEGGLGKTVWRLALLAGVILLLSAGAVFLFVRRQLQPLHQLENASAAIADGDFSVQVDEKKGDRELRALSKAFNTMTKKLRGVEENRKEFVANVSHELRSPITSIRGFAEGMADGVIPAEDQPKYLRLVANESKRLSSLIEDLLALSRLERDDAQLNMTDFDINEMLRRAVIRRMNDLDRKKIEIACEFEEENCFVHADSDRIEQVVINLLDNAIKFTPEGGTISLESAVKGDIAEITVRDNGSGVPEEDRDKVFDRFFTADRAHTAGKGTGLGLSISKRIMEMHGQTIRLLDTDSGAAFRFTLEHAGNTEDT